MPIWWWMVPVLLLLIALGANGVNRDAIWYDEWWSVYYAGSADQYVPVSVRDTWNRVAAESHELNPPGFYMALNVWSRLTAFHPAVLRTWCLLLSALCMSFLYRAGRGTHSHEAGLFAVLLMGTSTFFVDYQHEARAYMQMITLVSLCVWTYGRIQRGGRVPVWMYGLLGVGVVGLLYTHYMGAMFVAAAGLYHVILGRKDRSWGIVAGVVFVAVLLVVPWALRAWQALEHVGADEARDFFARDPFTLMAGGANIFTNGNIAILLALSWLAIGRQRMLWFLMVMTFVVAMTVHVFFHFLNGSHYLVVLFPMLALLSGVGLTRIGYGRWALLGAWVVMGAYLSQYPLPDPVQKFRKYIRWDYLLAELEDESAPLDTMLFLLPEPDPSWIHEAVARYYAYGTNFHMEVLDSIAYRQLNEYEDKIRDVAEGADRFWIVYEDREHHRPSPLTLLARDRLITEREMVQCGERFDYREFKIGLYTKPSEGAWMAHLDGDIQLGLANWFPDMSQTDLFTALMLTEVGEDVPPNTYSVSGQLENEAGEIVHQVDLPLSLDLVECVWFKFDMSGLPPGGYALYGTVYNWQTGERLDAVESSYEVGEDRRLRLMGFLYER